MDSKENDRLIKIDPEEIDDETIKKVRAIADRRRRNKTGETHIMTPARAENLKKANVARLKKKEEVNLKLANYESLQQENQQYKAQVSEYKSLIEMLKQKSVPETVSTPSVRQERPPKNEPKEDKPFSIYGYLARR